MFKKLAILVLAYPTMLLAGLLAAPVLGLPGAAEGDFPGNAQYTLQPRFDIPAGEILAAGQASGRRIIAFENGEMRVINQDEMNEWSEQRRAGETITPKGIKVTPSNRYAEYEGEAMTWTGKRQHNYALGFSVRDHEINVFAPRKCSTLKFESLALVILGVAPNSVVYCPANSTDASRKAIVTFYAVDAWFITAMYTQLTCALIHDRLAAKLGATVNGQEHICFGVREAVLLPPEQNPISVRHHIFRTAP